MGNIAPSQCMQVGSQHLEELSYLTNLNYNTSYRLSFDPFNLGSSLVSTSFDQRNSRTQSDFSISEEHPEVGTAGSMFGQVSQPDVDAQPVDSNVIRDENLQKNQSSHKPITKRKQIKKADKPRMVTSESQRVSRQPQISEEGEITTAPDQGIRDQNNCKVYHKLIKNYLQENKLGQMIQKYEKKYHTRYYFIVGLIFIKYYVNPNFTQTYAQIVNHELQIQQNKIGRKLSQKEKLQKRIKQIQALGGNKDELIIKRQKLDQQIEHIQVVKYEISQFSLQSCTKFFQGDLEGSLQILYLKDDPVMRKRYYFESALKIVKEIQDQVRKVASRKS